MGFWRSPHVLKIILTLFIIPPYHHVTPPSRQYFFHIIERTWSHLTPYSDVPHNVNLEINYSDVNRNMYLDLSSNSSSVNRSLIRRVSMTNRRRRRSAEYARRLEKRTSREQARGSDSHSRRRKHSQARVASELARLFHLQWPSWTDEVNLVRAGSPAGHLSKVSPYNWRYLLSFFSEFIFCIIHYLRDVFVFSVYTRHLGYIGAGCSYFSAAASFAG